MKLIITADPHLSARFCGAWLTGLSAAIGQHKPNAVVVAGDIGDVTSSAGAMKLLRDTVGSLPLAVCLGNHDYWLKRLAHDNFPLFSDIRKAFWIPACKEYDVTLLDEENFSIGDIVVVGGYGHYDLGQAVPSLQVNGVTLLEKHYLSGGLFWNDFRFIPNCADNLFVESRCEAASIAHRLIDAISTGKKVVTAIHTCPWRDLNGHPLGRGAKDLLSAYSGNSLVGKVLEQHASHISLVACGHTHFKVTEREIYGIKHCLNVGSDYGVMRGIVYDTDTDSVVWIGP